MTEEIKTDVEDNDGASGDAAVVRRNQLFTSEQLSISDPAWAKDDGKDEVVMNGDYEVHEVDLEDIEVGINVREIDQSHVRTLAESILAHRQLQECIGDRTQDGKIRLWAGQHRYWAVDFINRSMIAAGRSDLCRTLRIRVYNGELNPDQILAIQIAENLHQRMKPEEEAEVIRDLWEYCLIAYEEDEINPHKFAGMIGRSPDKVYASLRYSGLAEEVKRLVVEGHLTYTQSLAIASLEDNEQQENAANHLVLHGIQRQAKKYIAGLIDDFEKGKELVLFPKDIDDQLLKEGKELHLSRAAGRKFSESIKYFEGLVDRLAPNSNLSGELRGITPALSKIIYEYITSASDLLDWLWIADAELAERFEVMVIRYEEGRERIYFKTREYKEIDSEDEQEGE